MSLTVLLYFFYFLLLPCNFKNSNCIKHKNLKCIKNKRFIIKPQFFIIFDHLYDNSKFFNLNNNHRIKKINTQTLLPYNYSALLNPNRHNFAQHSTTCSHKQTTKFLFKIALRIIDRFRCACDYHICPASSTKLKHHAITRESKQQTKGN